MANRTGRCRALANDDRGQDLIEYALLFSLIAIALIGGLSQARGQVVAVWNDIASGIVEAVP